MDIKQVDNNQPQLQPKKQPSRKSKRGEFSLSLKKKDDFADWDINGDYKFEKILGQGSYGKVAQAIQLTTGKRVAIKKLDNIFDDETDCKRVLREITLLRQLRHPCVIELIEVCPSIDRRKTQTIYLVMEYAESDLKKLLKSNVSLEILHIQTLVYNLLCAIKYLHESKVLHRDLKPANVLVNEDCTIKLCDYGLARSITGVASAEVIVSNYKVNDKENTSSYDGNLDAKTTQASTDNSDSVDSNDKQFEPPVQQSNHKTEMKERLVKTKDLRQKMSRQLTGHVATRWYRAPEIILLEKDYGPAIDMWAVGCIFAELLSMMKENSPTFLDRKPLFPGKSCFPLSPAKQPQEERAGFPFSQNDQMAMIFEVIGTPNEDDRSFVTDQKALEYLDTFSKRERCNLETKYPGAPPEAIDFLDRLLQFNPYFRLSLSEAIEHPLFDKVRSNVHNCVGDPIELQFEQGELNLETMAQLFQYEIAQYRQVKQQ